MKYEITRKGVYDEKGKPVEIGTTIDIDGDLPGFLANKCRPLGGEGKTAVINPKKDDDDKAAGRKAN